MGNRLIIQSNSQELQWLNGTRVNAISEMHDADASFLEIRDCHLVELEGSSTACVTPSADLAFIIDGEVISGTNPSFDRHLLATIEHGGYAP